MVRRRTTSLWSIWQTPLSWFKTDQTDWVATRSAKSLPYWVALAAGLGLFLELSIIRWHGSLFSLFGFYKNFSLLSAFLGLGIGYAVGKRQPIRLGFVILFLCVQLALFGGVKLAGLHHSLRNPVNELLTMGLDGTDGWSAWFGVVSFLSIVYVLNALTFIPLGQIAAALMGRLPNLKGYGFNLAGSLAGILAFTALSYLWMPPEVWFVVVLAGLIAMMGASAAASPVVVICGVLFAVFSVFEPRPLRKNVYSPYQSLSIRPVADDSRVVVSVNQLYYQKILDLSRENMIRNPAAQLSAMSYDMPFQLSTNPDNVLIVGAGTGNDVAAALRRGAIHVDAVEIDPIIQQVGAQLHPEKPYSDPRVSTYINDARAFLREEGRPYDLIVYGLLDSHTMLSNLSNVRLDSFVYTVEAFQEARLRLKEDGMLALSFSMISDGLGHKLFRMLKEAFDGQEPIVLQPGYDGGVLFLAGGGIRRIATLPLPNLASRYASYTGHVDLSTDDWPFFYMPERKYPTSYALILIALLGVSIVLIRAFVQPDRRAGSITSSWVFFFLGAGFMLIETRSITELGLTFGNTWLVIALVISGILLMACAANAAIAYLPKFPTWAAFAGVALTLCFGWWFTGPQEVIAQGAWTTAFLCVLPLFFSGLLFSSALKDTASVATAMSANLFGSICGGLLEYHSMVAGFRSLYLLGLAMYVGAFAAYYWQHRNQVKVTKRTTGKPALRKVAASH